MEETHRIFLFVTRDALYAPSYVQKPYAMAFDIY